MADWAESNVVLVDSTSDFSLKSGSTVAEGELDAARALMGEERRVAAVRPERMIF
jgi:hypothetical protein